MLEAGGTVFARFTTQTPDGESANLDVAPTATLYWNGGATANVPSVMNLATGLYLASVTLPEDCVPGDQFEIAIAAVVNGVSARGVIWRGVVSAASGEGIVQVLPVVTSVQTQPVRSTALVAYERGAITHHVSVFDSLGQPIDLTGKALQFVIETRSGGQVGYSDTLSIEGAEGNVVVMAAPAAWHESPGLYRYAVRDLEDGARVWLHGDYVVERAAGPHG
jgi:hypothetical protein